MLLSNGCGNGDGKAGGELGTVGRDCWDMGIEEGSASADDEDDADACALEALDGGASGSDERDPLGVLSAGLGCLL